MVTDTTIIAATETTWTETLERIVEALRSMKTSEPKPPRSRSVNPCLKPAGYRAEKYVRQAPYWKGLAYPPRNLSRCGPRRSEDCTRGSRSGGTLQGQSDPDHCKHAAPNHVNEMLRSPSAAIDAIGDFGAQFGRATRERFFALPADVEKVTTDCDQDDSEEFAHDWIGLRNREY